MRTLLAALLAVLSMCACAYSQTAAGVMPYPNFQPLDNSGAVIPGGSVCVFSAGTSSPMNSYTDSTGNVANAQPLVLDASGRGNLWLKAPAKIVLYQPGGTGCPNSAVQIWSVDGVSPLINTPVFSTVTAATTFNSQADINGGNAFQTSGGTFTISGSGNGAFQEMKANHFAFVGFNAAPTAPTAGTAFMYYDTTIGALRYNLGGAGWLNIGGICGSSGQLQFNSSGACGSSANLAWNGTYLTAGAANTAGNGYLGTVFNSNATGGTAAVQTAGGTFVITGAGNAAFQSVSATNGYTANSVAGIASCTVPTAGAAITVTGGLVTGLTGC